MREIYLDNASTTKLSKNVYDIMKNSLEDTYANPSSMHKKGREARRLVEKSREDIKKMLDAKDYKVIFTSGATEANNMAILGVCRAQSEKKHIITSKIEHKSVLNTCKYLESKGYEVTYLDVEPSGVINIDSIKKAIKDNTVLISIMAVNNEIGTIMPIDEIGALAHAHNIIFHTDAVSALGKIPLNMENIDLISISGHKIYGPKGIGVLCIKDDILYESCIYGGGQEYGIRSGTENVPAIVAMSEAVKELLEYSKENNSDTKKKRDYLYTNIIRKIEDICINGDVDKSIYNNLNICIKDVDGYILVDQLSREGIYISAGSACNSIVATPSHVLRAIGKSDEEALSSIRISLDNDISYEELDYVVEQLKNIIEDLREI